MRKQWARGWKVCKHPACTWRAWTWGGGCVGEWVQLTVVAGVPISEPQVIDNRGKVFQSGSCWLLTAPCMNAVVLSTWKVGLLFQKQSVLRPHFQRKLLLQSASLCANNFTADQNEVCSEDHCLILIAIWILDVGWGAEERKERPWCAEAWAGKYASRVNWV
jgi:hypothetical protein